VTRKEATLQRLAEVGYVAKKSLGQNFLIGEHVIAEIVKEVVRDQPDLLVEIGPGLGALTDPLSHYKIKKILIELDKRFAEYWRKKSEEVIEADALRLGWQDDLPQKINQFLPTAKLDKVTVVSNLPYQISSRLVIELSTAAPWLNRMVLMFQKEVAERIAASPSSDDYGFLSVVAQTHWLTSRIVDADPEDFYPKPNVYSRVLAFRRRQVDPLFNEHFTAFVKKAFSQRRKYMVKAFAEEKQKLVQGLAQLGHSEKARAEELSPEQFREIYRYTVGK